MVANQLYELCEAVGHEPTRYLPSYVLHLMWHSLICDFEILVLYDYLGKKYLFLSFHFFVLVRSKANDSDLNIYCLN